MIKKIVFVSILAVILFITAVEPALGITWCHDYSFYKITGQDANKTSPTLLRDTLRGRGYKCFKFTNAAQDPKAQSKLREGDVIIIGDAHSGVVNQEKLIDHFIQKFGASGTAYSPGEILTMENFKRNWTLLEMVNFSRETPDGRTIQPYISQAVEVWRK